MTSSIQIAVIGMACNHIVSPVTMLKLNFGKKPIMIRQTLYRHATAEHILKKFEYAGDGPHLSGITQTVRKSYQRCDNALNFIENNILK